jgi:hypothetical protein
MPDTSSAAVGRHPDTGATQDNGPIAYTLSNAASAVGLSIATLRRLEKAGQLRFVKVRGRTLVCGRSLRALTAA